MADHAEDDGDDIISFVYRGGQRAPRHVTHVLIDEAVNEIEEMDFSLCFNLLQVDTHDGIRKIGKRAFHGCRSLRRINLKSALEIGYQAFYRCVNLANVEFGDRLERIGKNAFYYCTSLQHLKLPSVTTIAPYAFHSCKSLTDIELSERLESIGLGAFQFCTRLQRIAVPLKRDLFEYDVIEGYDHFNFCGQLTTVDLVGGIHKTVASLHMDSWRTEMTAEINRINQVLPNTIPMDKTYEIYQWMEVVMDKIDHYKAEHCRYVKEGVTLLELALWKAKLRGGTEDSSVERQTKKAKVDSADARKGKRITCGADIVIKNVLPFLQLE